MKNINLRDFLLKDLSGEEYGQRAEAVTATVFGLVISFFPTLLYRNPVVVAAAILTSLVAIFTLIQILRGSYKYRNLFPGIAATSICAAAILEGNGTHDLIWVGIFVWFLLANVYNRKNSVPAIALGVFMVILFLGTGLAEINNIIPNPFNTDLKFVVTNSIFFLVILGAMIAVFHSYRILLNATVENRNQHVAVNRQLTEINQTLEESLQSRTQDIHHAKDQLQVKSARLHSIFDISQSIISNIGRNPDELLTHITRLISEKLGYYHVGIFLLDENREYALLRAANSEGGQRMLARRHQLRVGGAGIVGYVSQSGRPRIALDTGADAVFFDNPDLPETHSEISLPLKNANTVIGVLDVQSKETSAFNEEDMNMLGALANQIALLLMEMQLSPFGVTTGRQNAQFGREKSSTSGYTIRPDGSIIASALAEKRNPALEKALDSGETVILNPAPEHSTPTLAVPVKFRDQTIGLIHIESADPNHPWTEDEVALAQAIADRAALALENARLFEEATRRAEQEATIAQVTTQIGASTDFERILQTTIRELGRALGASRSFIQIGTANGKEDKA